MNVSASCGLLPLPACGERVGVRGVLHGARLAETPPHPALRADLSPHAAGESHMDLRRLLPWTARGILKTTPAQWRESDGQIQEGFSAAGGPACGQCTARSAGGAVHRAGGGFVWGRIVLGHGGFRRVEGRAVAALPWSGA